MAERTPVDIDGATRVATELFLGGLGHSARRPDVRTPSGSEATAEVGGVQRCLKQRAYLLPS